MTTKSGIAFLSFSTVWRLIRKFSADVGPVISAKSLLINLVGSKSASSPKIVEKNIFLVKSDARYTSQRIADMVGISKASALCFGEIF